MGKRKDLAGQRFGRLVVEAYLESRATGKTVKCKEAYWRCVCDCGNYLVTSSACLLKGRTKSCGCLAKEVRSRTLINLLTKHGLSASKEYECWANMISRAGNEDIGHYKYRTVSEEWTSFSKFYEDMGPRPDKEHKWTLERVNNELGYSKENCVWALHEKQVRNRGIGNNNTSGVMGVSLIHADKYPCWSACWCDLDGKLHSKAFSIGKYGDNAFSLACDYRNKMLEQLNQQGAGYTKNHGHQQRS